MIQRDILRKMNLYAVTVDLFHRNCPFSFRKILDILSENSIKF
jgi:hypothetical protein